MLISFDQTWGLPIVSTYHSTQSAEFLINMT